MSNKEEQQCEIEALESIYCDDFSVLSEKPYHNFTIQLQAITDTEQEDKASILLHFTYVADYPETGVPLMEVEESTALSEENIAKLLQLMNEQAEENLGIVSVFTVVCAVQERMEDLISTEKEERQDAERREEREKLERELNHFDGTRCTVETFLRWKLDFDTEMKELKKKKGELDNSKKPTGKQLFMNDATLANSDLKFFQEDTVDVDESLFQDMQDLDLDADLDELDDL